MQRLLSAVALGLALQCALPAGGQILVPREEIPADLSPPVRAAIERLYSTDAFERREAAIALGQLGRDAVPAIPFLTAVANEVSSLTVGSTPRTTVSESPTGGKVEAWTVTTVTSPGEEAGKTIASLKRLEGWSCDRRLMRPLLAALRVSLQAVGKPVDTQRISHTPRVADVVGILETVLGDTADPGVVGPLRAALPIDFHELGWELDPRREVVEILAQYRSAETLPQLLPLLKHPEMWVRWEAAKALGALRSPAAVPALVDALADPSTGDEAAEALGLIGDPSAGDALVGAATRPGFREDVAKALFRLADPRAMAAVEPLLASTSSFDRRTGVEALAATRDPRAVPLLAARLADEDYQVRQAAAETLAGRDDAPHDAVLAALHGETNDIAQQWLAEAVAGHADPARAEEYLSLLAADRPNLPLVRALAKIGLPPARLEPLRVAARGSDDRALTAARVLVALSGEPAMVARLRELGAMRYERCALEEALAYRSDAESAALLSAALGEKGTRCQHEALEAMAKRRDPSFVAALTAALDGEWASAAIAALGAIGDPAALQVLLRTLEGGCGPNVGDAARALEAATGQRFGRDYVAWSRWLAAGGAGSDAH